jgi:recombination protein RecR
LNAYPKSVSRLIEELAKLPGVGEKSASRLAFHLIGAPKEDITGLVEALQNAEANIRLCPECFAVTDQELCSICADPGRDHSQICVVENTRDIYAIEKTHEYKGLYHVLHGAISPLEGVGPGDIKAAELIRRVSDGNVKEVIMATNPSPEGEATAMYLKNLLVPAGALVTRLAKGIPVGADVEYIDEITLIKAFEGRYKI